MSPVAKASAKEEMPVRLVKHSGGEHSTGVGEAAVGMQESLKTVVEGCVVFEEVWETPCPRLSEVAC